MKHFLSSLLFFLFITFSTSAQEYITKPGLDKFVGYWQSVNGNDTITFKIVSRYTGATNFQV